MLTESRIRQIIREELIRASSLHEAPARHGYKTMQKGDIEWGPHARRIHASENPFIRGSSAYKKLFNDGVERIVVNRTANAGTRFEYDYTLYPTIEIKEGDWVIVPHFDFSDTYNDIFRIPGLITKIVTKDARELGIPGAQAGQEVPLATVRFSVPGTTNSRYLQDAGLAFLVKVGGPRSEEEGRDWSARNAMDRYKSGKSEWEEKSARRFEREQRRAEREPEWEEPRPEPARGMPHTPGKPIRRVAGQPTASTERRPMSMSSDDVRNMLGVKKR